MIKVVYNEKQVADPGKQTLELQGYTPSPSAKKPMEVAQQLRSRKNIEFVDPVALSIEDIKLVHDPEYVDGIFSLKLENGFGRGGERCGGSGREVESCGSNWSR